MTRFVTTGYGGRLCYDCGLPLKGWEIRNQPHECDPIDEYRHNWEQED